MSRPVPPSPPDADRDAWLSEALRHAPDADVAPPPSLSEMILREAQAKVRPAMPAPRPSTPWWTKLWVWSARPAVGAGLASVMVASVVGVMMWDRPLEDASPRSRVDLPVPATAPAPEAAQKEAAPAVPREGKRQAAVEQAAATPPGVVTFASGAQPVTRITQDTQAFVALRAALSADPTPWTWQRDNGAPHAVDDTLGAFLAEVDAASRAGWVPTTAGIMLGQASAVETARAKGDTAPPDKAGARLLRLLRDGKPAHVLRLAGHSLYWERHAGESNGADTAAPTVRVLQLDDLQLQAVRAALDRLTP